MKKRILMLGAGFMQGVAIRGAKSRGWEVVAVDGNPQAVCASLADRFEPIDLKDRDAIATLACRLKKEGGLDGIFTAATDFSASVAYAAAAAKVPGHSFEAACNASDKLRMRTCFEAAGVPSPAFVGINQENRHQIQALLRSKSISFPVVVKPVDNMGARGCRKVDLQQDLEAAITGAIRYSRNGFVIVEEYMEGPEYSIEALVFDGEFHLTGLADRHIFFPPYFIEMGHTIPALLADEERDALVSVFRQGIAALGLTYGAAKGDIKLTPRGPMIGEIAGRLSGGYMSGWTFPYSSGIDLTGAALELAAGIRPAALEDTKHWTSAERAWISIPGKIRSVQGYEIARTVPFVTDVFPRANPGDTVDFPCNNVEKCGNCLAAAPDRVSAITAAEDACRSIFLRLEPDNAATDAFLAPGPCGLACFPPDAFPLPVSWSVRQLETVLLDENHLIPVPASLVPYLKTIRDWQGRTLADALVFLGSIETGLFEKLKNMDEKTLLTYWNALIRGGVQGIVYVYDCENK